MLKMNMRVCDMQPKEIERALRQTASGKSPRKDGIPAEVLSNGCSTLLDQLHKLFCAIWEQESVPHDFKDAHMVHIYRRKGDRAVCDNHRGIHYPTFHCR